MNATRLSPRRSVLTAAVLFALAITVWSCPAAAGTSVTSFEANLVATYSESDRWSGEVPGSQHNSVGFEHVARFSSDRGDFLTLDVQARLAYDTSDHSDDAVSLELHNALADLKLGLGRKLRLGHFAPEFGLEPSVDTHGTLLQTQAAHDIGFKKDWGVGYRATVGPLDVSLAAQLGAGMGVERRNGSYVVTARASAPSRANPRVAVAILAGEVLSAAAPRLYPPPTYAPGTTRRVRAGVDAEYVRGPLTLMCEISAGRNDRSDALATSWRADLVAPGHEEVTLKAQVSAWTSDLADHDALTTSVAGVIEYRLTAGWTARVMVATEMPAGPVARDTRVAMQAYFFGG